MDDFSFRLLTPIASPDGKLLRNGEILAYYEKTLNEVSEKRQTLDKARRTSTWRRVLGNSHILVLKYAYMDKKK